MLLIFYIFFFLFLIEKPKEPRDWSKVNFDKMRVKELREILTEWGEKCEGCTDKSDFIRLIQSVKDKHIQREQKKDL
jgi:hypothetical protein